MGYDAIIAGAGPAGLAAALALGRARKRVLLCDGPARRNAAAEEVHNFVTRDGTPPDEFRRIGRAQLGRYPRVEIVDEPILRVDGRRGAFGVHLETSCRRGRRILLCTGMIDELPRIDGLAPLWGRSVFVCPYCHAWEVQGRRFAYLALTRERLEFAMFLRGWSDDVIVLTNGAYDVGEEMRARLAAANVKVEERAVAKLSGNGGTLHGIEFSGGASLDRDVLFLHPAQRQVDLVRTLPLALDAAGYVTVHETTRSTSIDGIYAAGDLTAPVQSAIFAAAAGTQAAAALNHELTIELALDGSLG